MMAVDIDKMKLSISRNEYFNNLLLLCRKVGILIFTKSNEHILLCTITTIMDQCIKKQKCILNEMTHEIELLVNNINQNSTTVIDMEKIYAQYKEQLKIIIDIQILLKNFTDDMLTEFCCSTQQQNILTTENSKKRKRSTKNTKYIALYTNHSTPS